MCDCHKRNSSHLPSSIYALYTSDDDLKPANVRAKLPNTTRSVPGTAKEDARCKNRSRTTEDAGVEGNSAVLTCCVY